MSKREVQKFQIRNPRAMGIDIGLSVHYVCVPEGRDTEHVKKFGCFARDLYECGDWLKK